MPTCNLSSGLTLSDRKYLHCNIELDPHSTFRCVGFGSQDLSTFKINLNNNCISCLNKIVFYVSCTFWFERGIPQSLMRALERAVVSALSAKEMVQNIPTVFIKYLCKDKIFILPKDYFVRIQRLANKRETILLHKIISCPVSFHSVTQWVYLSHTNKE